MTDLPKYESTAPVYVNAELVPAGKAFATDKPVGRTWTPLNAEAKAKVQARDEAVLADAKLVAGDGDLVAKLDEREAAVRAELADEIQALQARAEAAEANAGGADDEAFEALAHQAKADAAEIADVRARLKVFEPTGPEAEAAQAKRDGEIAESFDLLNDHDFVKTGERAGRPKCSAVENIVGYPVFPAEIDTAWDKRSA